MATRVVDMTAIRTREQNVALLLQAKAMQEDAAEQKLHDLFPVYTYEGKTLGTRKMAGRHTNASRIRKEGRLVRVKPPHKSYCE